MLSVTNKSIMVKVVMLSVVMLSVIMLSVVMLNVATSGHKKMITHVVQFVVETAGVTDWLAVLVPPPQGRLRRPAVGAHRPLPLRRRLKSVNTGVKTRPSLKGSSDR
jgi:hypothetical protein